jgi:hypothetical protein
MPGTSVVGGSPVNLLKKGVQTGIPLSLLTVRNGAIDASRLGEPLATDAAPLLAALFASGAIAAGEAKAPVVALRLKAKMAGAAGNTLKVKFDDVAAKTPVADSTAKVKIVYEDRRKGLTKDMVGTELGTPGGGARPGLVTLKAAAAEAPLAMAPTNLAGGPPLELDIPGTGGTAFTVQATGTEDLFADVKIAIVDEDLAGTGTFTLVIALDHTEAGVELDQIATRFGPLVEVVGTPAAVPAKGETRLAGGADPETSAAKSAEASVLSD